MSALELRITLLVTAVIIVAAMYVWYRTNSKNSADNGVTFRDEELKSDIKSVPQFNHQDDSELLPEDLRSEFQNVSQELRQETIAKRIQAKKIASDNLSESMSANATTATSEMVVVFHVVARSPEKFTGPMIAQMMSELDLEHGNMGIYHYNIERFNQKQSVYCVANMLKPGSFNPNEMEDFTTPGLTLILQLPGPEDGLKSFNIMVEHAQRLAAFLNGELLDEDRNPLTKQSVSVYKEQVQLFSLRAGSKVAAG